MSVASARLSRATRLGLVAAALLCGGCVRIGVGPAGGDLTATDRPVAGLELKGDLPRMSVEPGRDLARTDRASDRAADRASPDRALVCGTIASQPATDYGVVSVQAGHTYAQVFTAGLRAGSVTLTIQLQILNSGQNSHLWAAIIDAPGGQPGQTVLVETEIAPLTPGWSSYHLDLGVPSPALTAGTQYALRLRSDAGLWQHTMAAGKTAPAGIGQLWEITTASPGWTKATISAVLTLLLEGCS
jgi:hypothetical protein